MYTYTYYTILCNYSPLYWRKKHILEDKYIERIYMIWWNIAGSTMMRAIERDTIKNKNKEWRQILKKFSTVSCVVLLVFPQALTHIAASLAMSVYSPSKCWILFWSESVLNMWHFPTYILYYIACNNERYTNNCKHILQKIL